MKFKTVLLATTALLLAGCTALSDTKMPGFDFPGAWDQGARAAEAADEAAERQRLADWWVQYNDTTLSALLDEGLQNSGDLALAASRVAQARARYGYAGANQLPSLSVEGGINRTRLTDAAAGGASNPSNSFSLSAVLNYEVDLWGRLANSTASARSNLLAADYNREAVRIALMSDIAQAYFNLRALDENIAITKNKAGASDGLTLRQAESELASARSQLPQITQARNEQESALAVLLGRSPQAIIDGTVSRGSAIKKLPVPPFAPASLPSSLLLKRPDIQAAEQQLKATNYDIGTARAAYFPTLSLGALLGTTAGDIGDMFRSSTHTWQLGGSLVGPLIDMGRTSANVELAQGLRDEAAENYKGAVRAAFKDVRDNLSAQTNNRERERAEDARVKALAETLRLARLRYKAGYSNHLEVLDAERGLYTAQLELVAAKLARLNSSVNLYKAFGGGWEPQPANKQ